eukprot:4675220-Prymnesium_polylepis.1
MPSAPSHAFDATVVAASVHPSGATPSGAGQPPTQSVVADVASPSLPPAAATCSASALAAATGAADGGASQVVQLFT